MRSIAFVGAGPTTLYALAELARLGATGLRIVVFEAQAAAGWGTPYAPGQNAPAMLANICSAEIPPAAETLLTWLQRRSPTEAAELGVQIERLDDRTFVPRLVLGRYFQSQFEQVAGRLRGLGNVVDIRCGSEVVDVALGEQAREGDGPMRVTATSAAGGEPHAWTFDHVVLATGHQWPSPELARPGCFRCPWPATSLGDVGAVEIGVLGSSLTAIDAVVAIALNHGRFEPGAGGLVYIPGKDADGLRMTMMSRKGLLPEADFWFPLPHRPLEICTPGAVRALVERLGGEDGLFDAVFDLFRRELAHLDPDYAVSRCPAGKGPEGFYEAYFADRAAQDAFVWARRNLAEAREGHARRRTTPWRDALLRLHEVVAIAVPHLSARDYRRFSLTLKPVLVDAYGAVPHESVERLLALHEAGRLEVLALGDDYRLDLAGFDAGPEPRADHRMETEVGAQARCEARLETGAALVRGGETRRFPVFIEATGQRALEAIQFPFLSLLQQGVVRDRTDEEGGGRGVVIDDQFRIVAPGVARDRLFCLSIPFILGGHPFAQGLTSSHEMGAIAARRLARVASASEDGRDGPTRAALGGTRVDVRPAAA
jgi:uncharacterized NAD(P)/FAD-binding protein YdhS